MSTAAKSRASNPISEDEAIRNGVLRFVREAALQQQPLPGELELVKLLGCSRQQVRRALTDLEHQGIVIRRQGAATIVDPLALRMNVRLEDQLEHTDLLERMGYRAAVEVIESRLGEAGRDVANLFTRDATAESFLVVKRWTADGVPAMVAENTLALPEGTHDSLDPSDSVFALAERAWGESVVWEVATPGVAALDARGAELLGLPVGSAVLTLEIVGVTASGRRVFHAAEMHNPHIVTYSFVRTVSAPWGGTRPELHGIR